LWKKGVEHGDISVGSLMWDDTNKCGILNDWDFAFIADGITKNGQKMEGYNGEHTGTLPFMALDIILDVVSEVRKPRIYRYE
ncbi:hypothetical protein BDQ17DRAFT_1197008, partial [Cyathus striatus]